MRCADDVGGLLFMVSVLLVWLLSVVRRGCCFWCVLRVRSDAASK